MSRHRLRWPLLCNPLRTAPSPPIQELNFINMSKGASPWGLQEGVIPSSPRAFTARMAKPLSPTVLPTPPVHHCPRHQAQQVVTTPCQSMCLAKKASKRPPVVADTQNLLMWNLGLTHGSEVESEDYDRYIKLVCDGLLEQQVKWIGELFMQSVPDQEEQQEMV
jgi:hypothetical protein